MDVDDDESVRAGVGTVVTEHLRLDAVVACAGWGLAGATEQTPISEAKAQFETNFWGAVRVVQAALPIMRRQGGGRVVLVSSIGGVIGIPFQAFYARASSPWRATARLWPTRWRRSACRSCRSSRAMFATDFTANRRRVTPAEGEDPYAATMARAVGLMEHDETNGVPPDDVAIAVARVLAADHPRRRVSVGKIGERVGIIGKRLIPYRIFEPRPEGTWASDAARTPPRSSPLNVSPI